MEVMVAPSGVVSSSSTSDFNFDSGCSTPYMSAPSSPKRFGNFYYSAPTSPNRSSAMLYRCEFDTYSSSVVPFNWEEQPGQPKSPKKITGSDKYDVDVDVEEENEEFEFDFSGQLDNESLTADELFDGGKIRPLKPPPGLIIGAGMNGGDLRAKSPVTSPRSPRKMIRDALSPRRMRRKNKDIDPFAAAIERTRNGADYHRHPQQQQQQRGRSRVYDSSSSSSSSANPKTSFSKPDRRETRSLSPSPFRVSEFALIEQQQQEQQLEHNIKSTQSSSSSNSNLKGSRKWSLKDFFLFRSASEGRATDKDPLRKFALVSKKTDDVKNSSFRSTDSSGSGSRRKGQVSAHELHYTANRAVTEELRKKTTLPYKQGLFGCLGFNPAVQGFGRRFDF